MGLFEALSLIREGIDKADWQKVCDGFEGMSGEKISPSKNDVVEDVIDDMRKANTCLNRIGELLTDHFNPSEHLAKAKPVYTVGPPKPVTPTVDPSSPQKWEDEDEQAILKEEVKRASVGSFAKRRGLESPVIDEVSSKVRAVKDSRARTNFEDFRVDNGTPKTENGTVAKRVPYQARTEDNRFKDDPRSFKQHAEESKRLSETAEPKVARPPAPKVHVECSRCHKEEDVEPIQAPKRLESSENATAYFCNSCIVSNRKSVGE